MLDRNLKCQHNFVSLLQDFVDIEHWLHAIREEFFDVPFSITKLILSTFRILYDDIVVHFNGPFPLLVEPVWEGEKLLDLMVEP
jgi:hypothetical protein